MPGVGFGRGSEKPAQRRPCSQSTAQTNAGADDDEIVGISNQIQSLKTLADRVANSDATVLITGETGTGKELFARRICRKGARRLSPFVAVNCAAIPETLIESELFGFEKGTFTGANEKREGVLALAHTGTLFLDEIGDLSLAAQAKLLRVLERKEFHPLGSALSYKVDFRVVAATHRILEVMCSQEKFREDLLYRLNVINLHIPPLRERPADIVPLARHFLSLHHRNPETRAICLKESAERYLEQQLWPGNARQLRNVLARACLLSDSTELTAEEIARLSPAVGEARSCHLQQKSIALGHREWHAQPQQHEVASSSASELDCLVSALKQTNWNKSQAARLLNCSRMTIHRKLARYELRPQPDAHDSTP